MGYVNKTYLSTQFKNFADKIAKVFSKIGHTHLKSDITDFPTSMPANGGNAATVGGHTVGVNVPSNAKFTDTTYSKLSEFTDDVGYVKNTDARLTDARNAKDVYAWAKASTKPTYTASEVGLGNVGNFKAVSTVANQGLSSTEKANARANIGAGTSSFSGSYNDLSNKPTIPSVGNGTVTIKQAGASKGTFTMNQSGNTTIELTDNNTWRGIQNNLTSDSTTDSLSANQGKVLKGLIDEKTNKEVTVAGNSGIAILVAVEPSDGTVGAGSRPDLYTYTILPVYGTEKGTICQGNDSRLSNTSEAIVNFTSGDSSTGNSIAPAVITSGETHKSLFNKISTAVKNVRWLLSKMGTTDISSIGNGTVTGALSTLNSNIAEHNKNVMCVNSSINYTVANATIIGKIAYIYLFGSTTIQLVAHKAYYIPNLIIDGFESKKLKGIGVTNTVESFTDSSAAFRCTVDIDDSRATIVPNQNIPSGYGVSVHMICFVI